MAVIAERAGAEGTGSERVHRFGQQRHRNRPGAARFDHDYYGTLMMTVLPAPAAIAIRARKVNKIFGELT